jgi:SnoaL-like domain
MQDKPYTDGRSIDSDTVRKAYARVERLCRNYLATTEAGDLEALLSNFTDEATVTSPISGKQPARDFYTNVMRITSARSFALKHIFIGTSAPSSAAVHFAYTRTIENGKPATIECVDVFELTEDFSRFTSVRIIYDTTPVQSDFVK